jgi:hypothetical protein
MTQTPTEPPPQAATRSGSPLHPSDILMNLIVALLAPMFLAVTGGDIAYARMAAIGTVNAYRIRNQADLISIAQIIGFGLAALGSLSLSMADDISLSMTLRLRGNANALNRSAEQNRRALGKSRNDDPSPHHAAPEADPEFQATLDDAEMIASVTAATRQPAATALEHNRPRAQAIPAPTASPTPALTAERRHQAMRAIAMVKEASELTASIPNLPITEREAASFRVAALGSAANELLTGASSPAPIPNGRTGQQSTI